MNSKKLQCVEILHNVLDDFDILKVMKGITILTKSSNTILFKAKFESDLWECVYSTSGEFGIAKNYSFEDIPDLKCSIKNKSDSLIGILSLTGSNWITLENEIKVLVKDTIFIYLCFKTERYGNFELIKTVCKNLSNCLKQILNLLKKHEIGGDTSRIEQLQEIDILIFNMIKILYDTIDYADLNVKNVSLEHNIVEMKSFLLQTGKIVGGDDTIKVYYEGSEKYLIFDKKRLQQILIIILQRIMANFSAIGAFLRVKCSSIPLDHSDDEILSIEIGHINCADMRLIFTFNDSEHNENIENFILRELSILMGGEYILNGVCQLNIKVKKMNLA